MILSLGAYPTALSDATWSVIAAHAPETALRVRPAASLLPTQNVSKLNECARRLRIDNLAVVRSVFMIACCGRCLNNTVADVLTVVNLPASLCSSITYRGCGNLVASNFERLRH